jgi:hypothetical protein
MRYEAFEELSESLNREAIIERIEILFREIDGLIRLADASTP